VDQTEVTCRCHLLV